MFTTTRNTPKTPARARAQRMFYLAIAGAALSIIGPYLEFAKATTGYQTGTMKGNDTGGVGGWPVIFGALALGLLFVATRTATLSARALELAAGGIGIWSAIYPWVRLSDVKQKIQAAQFTTVTVSGQIGFWAITLGGALLAVVAFTMAWMEFGGGRAPAAGMPMSAYGAPVPPVVPTYPQPYPTAQPTPQAYPAQPPQQYVPAPPQYVQPQYVQPQQPQYPQYVQPAQQPGQSQLPPAAPTYGGRR